MCFGDWQCWLEKVAQIKMTTHMPEMPFGKLDSRCRQVTQCQWMSMRQQKVGGACTVNKTSDSEGIPSAGTQPSESLQSGRHAMYMWL